MKSKLLLCITGLVLLVIALTGCSKFQGEESRPTKAELINHVRDLNSALVTNYQDLDKAQVATECIFDKTYDKLSTKFLNKMLETKDKFEWASVQKYFGGNDSKIWLKAKSDCTDELLDE